MPFQQVVDVIQIAAKCPTTENAVIYSPSQKCRPSLEITEAGATTVAAPWRPRRHTDIPGAAHVGLQRPRRAFRVHQR